MVSCRKKQLGGKRVYERLGCGNCHSGPYYANLRMYRIGDDVEFENGWDTPTLVEVWRTAPYMFAGGLRSGSPGLGLMERADAIFSRLDEILHLEKMPISSIVRQ